MEIFHRHTDAFGRTRIQVRGTSADAHAIKSGLPPTNSLAILAEVVFEICVAARAVAALVHFGSEKPHGVAI